MSEHQIGDVVGVTYLDDFYIVMSEPEDAYGHQKRYILKEFNSNYKHAVVGQYIRPGSEWADRKIQHAKNDIESLKRKIAELKAFKAKHFKKKSK